MPIFARQSIPTRSQFSGIFITPPHLCKNAVSVPNASYVNWLKSQVLWMVYWKPKQRLNKQDTDMTVSSYTEYTANDYYLVAVSENVDGFCLTQCHTGVLLREPENDLKKLAPLLGQVIKFLSVLDPGCELKLVLLFILVMF